MKKTISIVLACIILTALSFTGCGKDDKVSSENTSKASSSTAKTSSGTAKTSSITSKTSSNSSEYTSSGKDEQVSSDNRISSEIPEFKSIGNGERPPEDTVIKLFETVTNRLCWYATDDPRGPAFHDLNCEIYATEKEIDGVTFEKSNISYQTAVDKYSMIFSGELLDGFLSFYFADVDGVLYVTNIGGQTGYHIDNIKIELLSENENAFSYKATFNQVSINYRYPCKANFTVIDNEGRYTISSTDYFPKTPRRKD